METVPKGFSVLHRRCGGWLAVTDDNAANAPKIGVTGRSEADAAENYKKAAKEWAAILDGTPRPALGAFAT